jgi:hypothetical protein
MRIIIQPETEEDFGIIGVEQTKSIVMFNKPIHCGFSILELSKNHVQRCFYDTSKHSNIVSKSNRNNTI